LAKHNGILLEITARKGHCLTNGHIVKIAEKVGADLILNTDAHSSDELIDVERAEMIAKGAGADFSKMLENSKRLVEKVLR
jgi:histidinol phosphatase-like PHP family hydrolase